MRVSQAIRDAAAALDAEWGRLDAEVLMAHALGTTRSGMLLARMDDPAPAAFGPLLARRLAGEPVAYILGEAEFYGRRFAVMPAVLIPRGDSESVVEAALAAVPQPGRVLDLGTGSGALLLTILGERPGAAGVGIDRSEAALAVARGNAEALGLGERADLRAADWHAPGWDEGLGRFDLVIANPPYVEEDADLDASVRDHEPPGALFAGVDGLDDYRALVPQLPRLLTKKGVAVLEIGSRQARKVTEIADDCGFAVEIRRDLARRDRALVLRFALGKGESSHYLS
ncbi:peptide chain release factor N(5)-glutamine methyltransferase [Aurantiacibacter spongiae]|uniref:Release factor glutamine methyltransferase n=1 Tax=Aurantiacibacter spongiae TaxID=2488860 RepID=A0A3N5D9D4_9SPHN|nr:peptide chain release factor N(5)-glutamine methyltransferase [Aurantiacibacter spongiae]RPF71228.1 peptide chain release factor N(5)-glutamine methyltransferase [Aurantiacibacter spongiae]